MTQLAAIFDFDHTLIIHDSMLRFFKLLAGPVPFYSSALRGVIGALGEPDIKTKVKEAVCADFLKGKTAADLTPSIEGLRASLVWHAYTRQRLHWHQAAGHHIIIATGALDVYMPQLLQDVPYDSLICTRLEQREGVYTGRFEGVNCVRRHKADAVRQYLDRNNQAALWGYGNWRDDEPMLRLCTHRVVIGKGVQPPHESPTPL